MCDEDQGAEHPGLLLQHRRIFKWQGGGRWVGQVPAAPDSRGRPLLFVSTLRSQIIQNEELKSFKKKKIRIFIM